MFTISDVGARASVESVHVHVGFALVLPDEPPHEKEANVTVGVGMTAIGAGRL